MNVTVPRSGFGSPEAIASTVSAPAAMYRLIWASCCCGTVNDTYTGCTWLMTSSVESLVPLARTTLPWLSCRLPARPSRGERIVV